MKIIKVYDPEYLKKKIYSVTWEITKECNYKCSYCNVYSEGHDLTNIEDTIRFLNSFGDGKNLKITLFGGEPTLHPQIKDIVKSLNNDITLFTNLSGSLTLYQDLVSLKKDIELSASYHPAKVSFCLFYDKIKDLLKVTTKVKVVFMLDPTVNERYRDNYNSLLALGLSVEVHKVVYDNDRSPNSIEENQLIDADKSTNIQVEFEDNTIKEVSSEYLLSNGLNNFKYFKCQSGCNNLYISKEGEIYPCLDYRREGISLGHITEKKPEDLKETICILHKCTSDLEIPKERILGK